MHVYTADGGRLCGEFDTFGEAAEYCKQSWPESKVNQLDKFSYAVDVGDATVATIEISTKTRTSDLVRFQNLMRDFKVDCKTVHNAVYIERIPGSGISFVFDENGKYDGLR